MNDAVKNITLQGNATKQSSFWDKTVNALAQVGRLPGGFAQGALKAVFAPAVLVESVDARNTKRLDKEKYNSQVNAIRNSGEYYTQSQLIDAKSAGEISQVQYDSIINDWRAGNNPMDVAKRNSYVDQTPDTASRPATKAASRANEAVENWTNSWVPPPITGTAEFLGKAADVVGEATPAAIAAVATGGNALIGNVLSYGMGSATAFSSEMLEGSGDVGKAIVRAGTAYASEKLGGKLFGKMQSGSGAANWVAGAVGEGFEENIDGVLYSAITGDPYTQQEAIQDFALGTIAGGVIGGGTNAVINQAQAATINQSKNDSSTKPNTHNITSNSQPHGEHSTPIPFKQISNSTATSSTQSTSFTIQNVSSSQGNLAGSPEMSSKYVPSFGEQSLQPQTLEIGQADITGNAVPSTPDTEPWKFPEPEPNTVPFPDRPNADPDETPTTDPTIVPFPVPTQPEPNTIPFPTVQPEPDTPATDPDIIPFPAQPEPDTSPEPNTVPFPAHPDTDPETHPMPEKEPISTPLPAIMPVTEPKTIPQEWPEPLPKTQPEQQPTPVTTPEFIPTSAPKSVPEQEPQQAPDSTPNTFPSPQTQPSPITAPKSVPSTTPETSPNTHAQPMPQTQPVADPRTQVDPATQAQAQTDTQTAVDQQLQTALSIWSPAQMQKPDVNPSAQTSSSNRERKRERPTYDFHTYRGAGSSGRIFETDRYKTTFGALSSY